MFTRLVLCYLKYCGRLCFGYKDDKSQPLIGLARQSYKQNTIEEIISDKTTDEINSYSLQVFTRNAYQCLKLKRKERPKMSLVVTELERALIYQEKFEAIPQLSLEDIKQGTQNFSDDKCVGKGKDWKLYEGEFPDAKADGYATALVKRWDKKSREASNEFLAERRVLSQYKSGDKNNHDVYAIVCIEGYCNEMNEKIIVYEHGYNRSLDEHLDNASFSWVKRLKLCMDVARVLDSVNIDGIVLKQIKSSRILVNNDWDGKVSNLELSLIKVPTWRKQELAYYYETNEILAVLLEILCGRLDRGKSYSEPLLYLAERHLGEKENLDELVFEGIKEKIAPESLNLFTEIVKNFFNTPVSPGNVGHVLQDAYLEQASVFLLVEEFGRKPGFMES